MLGLRRRCCRRVTVTPRPAATAYSCALHDGEMADGKGRRRKSIIQSCSAELLQPVEYRSDPDQTVAPISVKRVSLSHLPQPERPLSTALPPGPLLERCPRRRQATSTTCMPTTPRPTFGPSLASSPGPAPRLGRLWGSRSSQTASISSVAAPTMTQACVKPPGCRRPSEAADSVAVALDGEQPRDPPSSLRALLYRESRLGAACPGQAEAHDRTPLARLVSGTGEGSQTYAALCSPAPARRRL